MGFSYKKTVEMFGTERADSLFKEAGIEIKGPKSFRDSIKKPDLKLNEYEICKVFHNRLEEQGIKHTHIANEAGQSGSKNIMIMMAKKKAIGVSKGFPDYLIYLPNNNGKYSTLYLEMKKFKGVKGGLNGSSISDEQVEWIQILNNCVGSYAFTCHGYNEAIDKVEEIKLIIN